ncbi:hypothetical protein Spith_0315 [Spirochaeta thermophila DSM 6578]|uniref:Uncharacterized protein n=1 Tax=Winmispira thermophila (strain ATCC 700085 / DSM 6578 / Z-1203) TaxID=869211 RepID=G0GDW9_WINT7|nr:hypothetical protein [Spirochaeta thermophila]AEJ60601.1 hypothetical protein Spith_0315 [Spirochaeta thermophila DSM 6578]
MEVATQVLPLTWSDPEINAVLASASEAFPPVSRHFTQNEDFFLLLPREFSVPHLPVHHDIRETRPSREYLRHLLPVVRELVGICPGLFHGLTHLFDPASILRPAFFRLYRMGEALYLYLLRIDLSYHPHDHTLVEQGTNDTTPSYRTRKLMLEADLIPLEDLHTEEGRPRGFLIRQVISRTWIGEMGRGYFVQGIWLDRDLSKFFSSVFLPEGARTYPYYPLTCKYRSICLMPPSYDPASRKTYLPFLYRAQRILEPYVDEILEVLRKEKFSPDLPLVKEIRSTVPREMIAQWEGISIARYLNEHQMREYRLDVQRHA